MSQIQPADYSARRKAILIISAATVIGGLFIVVFESHRPEIEKWFLEEAGENKGEAKLDASGTGRFIHSPTSCSCLFLAHFSLP